VHLGSRLCPDISYEAGRVHIVDPCGEPNLQKLLLDDFRRVDIRPDRHGNLDFLAIPD
jgi:hypothetical protein